MATTSISLDVRGSGHPGSGITVMYYELYLFMFHKYYIPYVLLFLNIWLLPQTDIVVTGRSWKFCYIERIGLIDLSNIGEGAVPALLNLSTVIQMRL